MQRKSAVCGKNYSLYNAAIFSSDEWRLSVILECVIKSAYAKVQKYVFVLILKFTIEIDRYTAIIINLKIYLDWNKNYI